MADANDNAKRSLRDGEDVRAQLAQLHALVLVHHVVVVKVGQALERVHLRVGEAGTGRGWGQGGSVGFLGSLIRHGGYVETV